MLKSASASASASFGTSLAAASMIFLSGPLTAWSGPDPIVSEPLTGRHVFTDRVSGRITLALDGLDEKVIELDDVSNVAVVKITIPPGAVFAWHTHPGPVLAPVAQGELVYIYAEDCVRRPYPAGTAFVDPGFDNVHTAFNPSSDEDAVVMATFLAAPDEGALMLPVDEEEGTALDEKCGIDRDGMSGGR